MDNPLITSGWTIVYFILTAIYLLCLSIYVFFTRRDFRSSSTSKLAKASYYFFIIALVIKSIGYCASACCIIKTNEIIKDYPDCKQKPNDLNKNNEHSYLNDALGDKYMKYQKSFMISSSVPGYVISAAYCIIFFSWCSICIEVMEKKSSSFYGKSRYVLSILLAFIVIEFVVVTSVFFVKNNNIFHNIEAAFAIIRDVSIAVCFIIYLVKMWQIFADPCGCLKTLCSKGCCCCDSSKRQRQESISLFIDYEAYNDSNSSNKLNSNKVSNTDQKSSSRRQSSLSSNNNSYETALVLMCLCIIISLIIRAISILVYTVTNNNKPTEVIYDEDDACKSIYGFEYTKTYLAIFIIETILSELLPVISIISYRIFQPGGMGKREPDIDF